MGQLLFGSAMTTQAVRAVIQQPKVLILALNQICIIDPKTAQKYRMRVSVEDRRNA